MSYVPKQLKLVLTYRAIEFPHLCDCSPEEGLSHLYRRKDCPHAKVHSDKEVTDDPNDKGVPL